MEVIQEEIGELRKEIDDRKERVAIAGSRYLNRPALCHPFEECLRACVRPVDVIRDDPGDPQCLLLRGPVLAVRFLDKPPDEDPDQGERYGERERDDAPANRLRKDVHVARL
jgi:hypothetical protein